MLQKFLFIITSRKEEPDGTKNCPITPGQHLLWHMLEKKMKRTKQRIRIKKKEEEEYKRKEGRQMKTVLEGLEKEIEAKKEKSETHSEKCNIQII